METETDLKNEEDVEQPPYFDFAAVDVEHHTCSLCCCFQRVGNLIVICETPRRRGVKRNLLCVVGPYWQMMVCVTTPLIAGPCIGVIFFMYNQEVPVGLIIAFAVAALLTLLFLWKTATTDPGLVVRYSKEPPESTEQAHRWAWDDRTQSWRVLSARYAEDCRVLVDGYDHTCPWTGTAIGAGNIRWFYLFTFALIPLSVFLVICLIVGLSS